MKAMQTEPSFFSGFYASKELSIPPEPASRPDLSRLILSLRLPDLWSHLRQFWRCHSFVSRNLGMERKYLGAFAFHQAPGRIDTLKVTRFAHPDLPNYELGFLLQRLQLYEEAQRLTWRLRAGVAEEHHPVFDACGALLLPSHTTKQPGLQEAG